MITKAVNSWATWLLGREGVWAHVAMDIQSGWGGARKEKWGRGGMWVTREKVGRCGLSVTGNSGWTTMWQRAPKKQLRTRKHKKNQDRARCSCSEMFSCPNRSKVPRRRWGEGQITLTLLLARWGAPLPKIWSPERTTTFKACAQQASNELAALKPQPLQLWPPPLSPHQGQGCLCPQGRQFQGWPLDKVWCWASLGKRWHQRHRLRILKLKSYSCRFTSPLDLQQFVINHFSWRRCFCSQATLILQSYS